jgi:cobalt-zinc-cadmium efflux system protein
VALLADAGHNLSDVLGLLLAWGATWLMRRAPTRRYTYGLGSSSILAALANAVLLLIAVGAIALEAVQRLVDPHPVAGLTVMVVAGIDHHQWGNSLDVRKRARERPQHSWRLSAHGC